MTCGGASGDVDQGGESAAPGSSDGRAGCNCVKVVDRANQGRQAACSAPVRNKNSFPAAASNQASCYAPKHALRSKGNKHAQMQTKRTCKEHGPADNGDHEVGGLGDELEGALQVEQGVDVLGEGGRGGGVEGGVNVRSAGGLRCDLVRFTLHQQG